MKTLLTGLVSALIIILGVLFFCEYIPQARMIKQNHPTLVIVIGVILMVVGWHALHTILLAASALLAPIPIVFIHASCRSSENLASGSKVDLNQVNTPFGQILQIFGFDASLTNKE